LSLIRIMGLRASVREKSGGTRGGGGQFLISTGFSSLSSSF
jgi:hypothetical protein